MNTIQEPDSTSFYSLYCKLQSIHDRQTQDLQFKLHHEQLLFEKEYEQWQKEKCRLIEENEQLSHTIHSLKKLYDKIRHKKHNYADRYNKLVSKVSGINISSSVDVSQHIPTIDVFADSVSSDEDGKEIRIDDAQKHYQEHSSHALVDSNKYEDKDLKTEAHFAHGFFNHQNQPQSYSKEQKRFSPEPIDLSQENSRLVSLKQFKNQSMKSPQNRVADDYGINFNTKQWNQRIEQDNEATQESKSEKENKTDDNLKTKHSTKNASTENEESEDPRSPLIIKQRRNNFNEEKNREVSHRTNSDFEPEEFANNQDNTDVVILNQENIPSSPDQKTDSLSLKKNKKKRKRKPNKLDSSPSGKRRKQTLANIDDPFASQSGRGHSNRPRIPPAVARAIELKRRKGTSSNKSPSSSSSFSTSSRKPKERLDFSAERKSDNNSRQRGNSKKRKVEYPYVYEKGELVRKKGNNNNATKYREDNFSDHRDKNLKNDETETIAIRTAPTFVAKDHTSDDGSKETHTNQNDQPKESHDSNEIDSYPNPFSDSEVEEPGFIYRDVVRKKSERKKLVGHDCPECRDFYEKAQEFYQGDISKLVNRCSRHRCKPQDLTQDTPDDFWCVGSFEEYDESDQHETSTTKSKDKNAETESSSNQNKRNDSDPENEVVEMESIFIGTANDENDDFVSPSY